MARWRLAKSLTKLREQINAAAPNRSKASDGSIGDTAHSTRPSDHNPLNGIVHAIDVTHDPTHGVDGKLLSRWLAADKRSKYVIFSGEIWKARIGRWERYTGPNKHNQHVHVSVTTIDADDDHLWEGIGQPSTTNPVLRRGDQGEAVKRLQTLLTVEPDGDFGPITERFVRKFQKENGLEPDGIVGKLTWTALDR